MLYLVPKGRFELPQAFAHLSLKQARLPIPPLRHKAHLYSSDQQLKIALKQQVGYIYSLKYFVKIIVPN